MKYNCLIIDDEPIAQKIIESYISNVGALQLKGKCNNAYEALDMLHSEEIDILFLDINMPSMSGLEMLKTLQNPPKVILTTAFSEFGVISYEFGIIDYLLKPIRFDRFLSAINKILITDKLILDKKKLEDSSASIFFKADKKIHKYFINDILYIEGSGNYVKIYSEHDKPLLVLDKLVELQNKLPVDRFIRVHKSYIINLYHVQSLEGNLLKIKNKLIPISASYRKNFEKYIDLNN